VFEFVAGDMSHSRTDEIYAKQQEMNDLVKMHRHVLQTELVLHDLDEATKEKAQAVHNKKLFAVSFGLVSVRTQIKSQRSQRNYMLIVVL
jgi:hypothetical protein